MNTDYIERLRKAASIIERKFAERGVSGWDSIIYAVKEKSPTGKSDVIEDGIRVFVIEHDAIGTVSVVFPMRRIYLDLDTETGQTVERAVDHLILEYYESNPFQPSVRLTGELTPFVNTTTGVSDFMTSASDYDKWKAVTPAPLLKD